ncbi:dTMP kinase [Glaciecola sp. XM2]|uniref:dTMP kinase n=1 Tax=Glaciecola sp. XM2 TaxID=1914931 RepID=UPI001BDF44EC|nr:dTMP kinase [Glaciecola sp. XM2]
MASFIVVEGLEGAGKSSVIARLMSVLKEHQFDVINTREPGGTPMAEAIRDCVKQDWDESVTQETELLLMYAARSQLVENIIKPALKSGTWVIGDRHDLSSVAYQGGGRGVSLDTLKSLRQMTLGDFAPHFTLYLDIEPSVGLARARGRGELDRIEQAGLAFFERARQTYQEQVASMPNAVTVDASQAMQKVQDDAANALNTYIKHVLSAQASNADV